MYNSYVGCILVGVIIGVVLVMGILWVSEKVIRYIERKNAQEEELCSLRDDVDQLKRDLRDRLNDFSESIAFVKSYVEKLDNKIASGAEDAKKESAHA